MKLSSLSLVGWTILLQALASVAGERLREQIYVPIVGASCFRRLNGTHQTGCTSAFSGSVGALHLVDVQEDLEFLLGNPTAPPYAPMIPPHLFTRDNMLRLKAAGPQNISVVLLINRTEKMTSFSPELNCPNRHSGLLVPNSTETATCDSGDTATSWNPWGSGLLHEDFPFPIYYIIDVEEIDKLVDCFKRFNNFSFEGHATRSLCSVEVNTFMSAAKNSEVCIRRSNFINNLGRTKYCDPLEGRNIYATLYPRPSTDSREVVATEKFILVSCRLDTTSMFEGVGLGALDSLFSMATLVNVAHMLTLLLPETSSPSAGRNILFMVFNGESYDYIGSQRFVYDMERLAFPKRSSRTTPISFENIEYMLDLGTLDDIALVRLHTLSPFAQSEALLAKLQQYGGSYGINFESATGYKMPPTSAQSFLRHNASFPALILNAPPTNRYYHSVYDDMESMNFIYANTTLDFTGLMDVNEAGKYFAADSVQMRVRNISTVVALALYEQLLGTPYKGTLVANPLLADEFLYCFLQSADCPLFKAASHPNSLPGLPIPPMRYISVAGGPQEASGWTYRLLGYLVSQRVANQTKESCVYLPLHWFAGYNSGTGGECRWTTHNYSHALSPAFIIEDYNWKSGQYSTWTESTWMQLSARMFLRPSKFHEALILTIGVVVLTASFCLAYVISSRSEVLFENAPSSTAALAEPTAC